MYKKKKFGLIELVILLSVVGMTGSLIIRVINPELLRFSWFETPFGMFSLGVVFLLFLLMEMKSLKSKDVRLPERIFGSAVRVPLFMFGSIYFFYMFATSSIAS